MPHLVLSTTSTRFRRSAAAAFAASALMLVGIFANRTSLTSSVSARPLGNAIDWNGWIANVPEGDYTFTVPAGAAAELAIDGRVVAGGAATTPVHLDRSPRAFDFLDRRPDASASSLEARWSVNGSPPDPIPWYVLFARKPRAVTLWIASALRLFEVAAEWLWVITLVVVASMSAANLWSAVRPAIVDAVDWPALRWIVLGSTVLNAIPIWWGLPSIWPPDELTPGVVLRALEVHFSNGWFDRWPPLHYYVLTAAMSPVLLLNALGRIDYSAGMWPSVLTLVDRAVSVAAAAGTLIAIAVVASRVFGRRAGLFAAAIFALAVPLPYYAKTANLDVPYVFWFAVSLVFYVRLLDVPTIRDAIGFAALATLAVCTKDQAYALYPLIGLAIGVRAWQVGRAAPLVAGVATAGVIFSACHNLIFNWNGFVSHVRYIVGPGSESYRVFPPTLSGRLQLLGLTASLIKVSWGWPLTLICGVGVIASLSTRRLRVPALLLVAPAVSYYAGFINVVLYNYDRFVLPLTLILAMFGGVLIDNLLTIGGRSHPRSQLWMRGGVALLFGYSLLYAATVDALMVRDSRYVVRQWASDRLRPGEQVGISGPRELEPGFTVPVVDIGTRARLEQLRPAYYVLSADYARAVPLDTDWGQLIAALQTGRAGYALIGRVRCQSPWRWLPDAHPELVGPRPIRQGGDAVSVLRDINPTLEVYALGGRRGQEVACSAGLLP